MYEIFEALLAERGVTAYQVAKATGISTGSLSDWKNGRSSPKVEKLQKIAAYFGVSMDELLGTYTKPRGKTISTSDPNDRGPYLLGKLGDGTITPDEHEELKTILIHNRIGGYLQKLSPEGQREAEKRVKELTEIPRYQLQTEAPTADATPAEGKDPAQE